MYVNTCLTGKAVRLCLSRDFIRILQQRCASKLFCLEILSSFVLVYLMYPYYPSLPIYCYHFVINLDNSHNISQSVSEFIIAYTA